MNDIFLLNEDWCHSAVIKYLDISTSVSLQSLGNSESIEFIKHIENSETY